MPWAKRSSRLATDRRALSGVVLSQLAKEGAPIICGSLPAYFEMKTMVDFMDMQSYSINLSCAEMMAHYGIPHAGTSGSGEGWGADLLSAGEIWANQLTSVIGKVCLAPFVGIPASSNYSGIARCSCLRTRRPPTIMTRSSGGEKNLSKHSF